MCEHLFLGIEVPHGLLKDGEVSARVFAKREKLDCLRSPHLYREHGVRRNVVNEDTKKWFRSDALYTSSYDLISKLLQFDCDGDKSLVVADELFVSIAERNMHGIVPLYYEMAKAGQMHIDNMKIYDGLQAAYSGGNIGEISNTITKIWNSGEMTQDKLDVIKWLCFENNATIDKSCPLMR